MRSLVTGGTGFVGANLVRALLSAGDECHLIVRERSQSWRLRDLQDQVRWHRADVADADSVRSAFQAARPDRAFHLAVYGAYSWQQGLERMLRVNVTGADSVLSAAAGAGCGVVVVAGSSSEYGDRDHAPSEDEAPEPASDYAVSKVAATLLVRQRARDLGIRAPVLRLYSVYGPFEDPRRLVPTLVRACLAGRLPPLADADTVRDLVYVDDVVSAHLLASTLVAAEASPVFNIGSGQETSLRDLVAVAGDLFGVTEEPAFGSYPQRQWDTAVWVADPRRALRELGWTATTSLRDGLLATAAWLRSVETPGSG